ncbi:MAG TPA: M48 family peptidase [Terriglobales bacterium]|nr:M48 family peptidase [Terriglobales bacterium]
MKPALLETFETAYRELRPRAAIPQIRVEFFPFANINNTIRLRDGVLLVRISDLLEGAPQSVLHAIAHILLAKIYRKPIADAHAVRYRRHIGSHEISEKAHLLRGMRGRKKIEGALGNVYDLEAIFEDLNSRFFYGLLARPQMTWSQNHSRNALGHYDPAHNTIVVSRVFDHVDIPRYVVEYIVYHEMLHLKHPVKLRGSRRCVHSQQFQEEEKLYPQLAEAKKFLKLI